MKAPRRGSTHAELEQVARIYQEHIDRGPVEAVKQLMGYGSTRTGARRVKEAEAAGLLPATTPGKRRRAQAQPAPAPAPANPADDPTAITAEEHVQAMRTRDPDLLRELAARKAAAGRPDLELVYLDMLPDESPQEG